MTVVDAPPLLWRIGVLMAERDIRTVRALRQRLREVGYEISEPQLGRLRKRLPAQVDTRFLAALCVVLKARPGDLLVLPGQSAQAISPRQTVVGAPEVSAGPVNQGTGETALSPRTFPITGPRLRAIPKPKV